MKENIKKKLNKSQGVTLVSLVITIIVLLILAGVAISLTIGENGIFKLAIMAGRNYVNAQNTELAEINRIPGIAGIPGTPEIPGITGTDETPGIPGIPGTNPDDTIDTENTFVSQITSVNYGDYVSGYGIDLGIATAEEPLSDGLIPATDWRIFYKDSTNVYLIASDYLPTSKYPEGIFSSDNGKYSCNMRDVYKDSTLNWTVTSNNGFMFDKLSNVTNTNESYQVLTTLLDSSNWSSLADEDWVDDTLTAVIGSPTIEMWAASWSQKYNTDMIYCDANSTGYKIGFTSDNLDTTIGQSTMRSKVGYGDTLYYPHANEYGGDWNDCYGYYLSTPTARSQYRVSAVRNRGDIDDVWQDGGNFGVRPVVCIASDCLGSLTEENGVRIWELGNSTGESE